MQAKNALEMILAIYKKSENGNAGKEELPLEGFAALDMQGEFDG